MFRLVRSNENVNQIRLDFLYFRMDGGSVIDRPCNRDKVTIGGRGGQVLRVGTLCGNNKGQHLYIPAYEDFEEVATIKVEVGGLASARCKWNVKVTQVIL